MQAVEKKPVTAFEKERFQQCEKWVQLVRDNVDSLTGREISFFFSLQRRVNVCCEYITQGHIDQLRDIAQRFVVSEVDA